MENATLLVIIGKSAKPFDLEPLSETARDRNLHLFVLILGAMPPIPANFYAMGGFGAYSLPDGWQDDVDRANAALETLRTDVSKYLADQGTSADVQVVGGETVALSDAVARAALTCDAVIIGDDLRDDGELFGVVVRAALFRAPAGVMLNAMTSMTALQPRSVFVAWKAGVPAARAVRAAIPMLSAAADVTIALFDPVTTRSRNGTNSGTDVATWLSHRGCNVTVQQYPSGGEETGSVMMKRAKETAADLIVMGAYDHSRLREVVFGGTTRTMIDQRDWPVLLCH